MYQQFDDARMMGETALGFRQIHIRRFVPGQGHGRALDTLPDALRLPAYEALIGATMDVLERHSVESWARGEARKNTLEPADHQVEMIARNRLDAECHGGRYADCWYSSIVHFKASGVSARALARAIDWGASIWPRNDWEALR